MAENRKDCPNRELNNQACTCPNVDCAKHGICCECVQNHLKLGNLPRCFVAAGITGN